MSTWVCCNSCFHPYNADRKLAITDCGHIICNVCYQKVEGVKPPIHSCSDSQPDECLICYAQCQIALLSNNSSSQVKAMFTDISVLASKHLAEISKVLDFQAHHQKRLTNYYQERSGKQDEVLVQMREERQHMTAMLNEQSAYITKLENSLQRQRAKVSSVPHPSHSSHASNGQKPVPQMPYNRCCSRHSSTDGTESMEVDERSQFKKPLQKLSLFIHPQDRLGTTPHGSSNENVCLDTLSLFKQSVLAPAISKGQRARGVESKYPFFTPPSSFRRSRGVEAKYPYSTPPSSFRRSRGVESKYPFYTPPSSFRHSRGVESKYPFSTPPSYFRHSLSRLPS